MTRGDRQLAMLALLAVLFVVGAIGDYWINKVDVEATWSRMAMRTHVACRMFLALVCVGIGMGIGHLFFAQVIPHCPHCSHCAGASRREVMIGKND